MVIRYGVLLVALLVLVVLMLLRRRVAWGYLVAPITYTVHVLTFFSFSVARAHLGLEWWLGLPFVTLSTANEWSIVVHLHGLLLLGGIGLSLLRDQGGTWYGRI